MSYAPQDIFSDFKKYYELKKDEIKKRLNEFKNLYIYGDDTDIFMELCFCILTANTSAQMGINAIEKIKDIVIEGNVKEIENKLHGVYRFYKKRAEYIVQTREYIKNELDFSLKNRIDSLNDHHERRDFFASNRHIKGIGYKEASHFLRNIGFKGYAILDKHILTSLHEFGFIDNIIKPTNKKRYLAIEEKMKEFSENIGIDMDELDLLLWSRKTGRILK
jgi:N-glycosylase/DNA lyase